MSELFDEARDTSYRAGVVCLHTLTGLVDVEARVE